MCDLVNRTLESEHKAFKGEINNALLQQFPDSEDVANDTRITAKATREAYKEYFAEDQQDLEEQNAILVDAKLRMGDSAGFKRTNADIQDDEEHVGLIGGINQTLLQFSNRIEEVLNAL